MKVDSKDLEQSEPGKNTGILRHRILNLTGMEYEVIYALQVV